MLYSGSFQGYGVLCLDIITYICMYLESAKLYCLHFWLDNLNDCKRSFIQNILVILISKILALTPKSDFLFFSIFEGKCV